MADAAVLVRPLRTRILELLAEPRSAVDIARTLDVARQKVGYHLKVLEKHGLLTWGETARESYERTIDAVTRAERYAAERSRTSIPVAETSSVRLSAQPEHVLPRLRDELAWR